MCAYSCTPRYVHHILCTEFIVECLLKYRLLYVNSLLAVMKVILVVLVNWFLHLTKTVMCHPCLRNRLRRWALKYTILNQNWLLHPCLPPIYLELEISFYHFSVIDCQAAILNEWELKRHSAYIISMWKFVHTDFDSLPWIQINQKILQLLPMLTLPDIEIILYRYMYLTIIYLSGPQNDINSFNQC